MHAVADVEFLVGFGFRIQVLGFRIAGLADSPKLRDLRTPSTFIAKSSA